MGDTGDHTTLGSIASRIAALPRLDECARVGFRREQVQPDAIESRGRSVLRDAAAFGLVEIEDHARRAFGHREHAGHRDPRVRCGWPREQPLALQIRKDVPAVGGFDQGIQHGESCDRAVAVDALARSRSDEHEELAGSVGWQRHDLLERAVVADDEARVAAARFDLCVAEGEPAALRQDRVWIVDQVGRSRRLSGLRAEARSHNHDDERSELDHECSSSIARATASSLRWALVTLGNFRSRLLSASTTAAATTRRVNHL